MSTGDNAEQIQVPAPVAPAAVHRFECDPNLPSADKKYKHWKRTFTNFLGVINDGQLDKLDCLINYVSSDIFDLISDCNDYDTAIQILDQMLIPSHVLTTWYRTFPLILTSVHLI